VPCRLNRCAPEPFPHRCVDEAKEAAMNQREKDEDLPHKDRKEIEREAEKSRKELESVPAPGTDPLHEGP
jgi:hypothetical protein